MFNHAGRDTILEELRERLNASTAVTGPAVLQGIGGVGKTQIVTEYLHRFAADYDIVWWISADQPSLVPQRWPTLPTCSTCPLPRAEWRSRSPRSWQAWMIDINVFTREESIELISRRVPGIDPADADAITEKLGDLQLEVEQQDASLRAPLLYGSLVWEITRYGPARQYPAIQAPHMYRLVQDVIRIGLLLT